jgi:hypothetical protein
MPGASAQPRRHNKGSAENKRHLVGVFKNPSFSDFPEKYPRQKDL